jgi:oligopeptide transport system substrate-binding protein
MIWATGLSILVLVGCQRFDHVMEELSIQAVSDPTSLNAHQAEDGNSLRIVHLTMNGLMAYNAKGELGTSGADSIEAQNNHRIYRVKIAEHHRWQDGSAVTAEDYIRGWRYALSAQVVSPLADFLFVVKGAKDFKSGALSDFSKVGVRAIDAKTLEFETTKPCVFFPHLLTMAVTMPRHIEETADALPRWFTGLYKIDQWKRDHWVLLRRRDEQPPTAQRGKPLPRQIRFLVVPDESTALNLWKSGKLHIATRVAHLEMKKLQEKGYVEAFPFRATYYLGFRHDQKPWDQLSHRRAVRDAIDTYQIQELLGVDAMAAKKWIEDGAVGANAITSAEISSDLMFKSNDIQLTYDAGGRNQIIVENIQHQIKTKRGVLIRLRARDWKTHLQGLSSRDSGFFRFGWLSPFLDPLAHLMVFQSNGANNHTGWASKEYDSILEKLGQQSDGPGRQRLIQRAVQILHSEAVVIPIYHYKLSLVYSDDAKERFAKPVLNPLGHFHFL